MSDSEKASQGTPAHEAKPATPELTASAASPAPDKPKIQTDDLPPEALKARLERERDAGLKQALQELGVEDIKDAKKALDAYKKLQLEQMSETERLRAERDELAKRAARADEYSKLVSDQAIAALSSLTETQRETVAQIAGDDPVSQLKVVTQLRASGLLGSKPDPKPPMPAPASTAPAQSAPAPAATTEQEKALSTYESLQKQNPVEAARYFQRNITAISAARQAQSA